jgi:hypothetical protein
VLIQVISTEAGMMRTKRSRPFFVALLRVDKAAPEKKGGKGELFAGKRFAYKIDF